MTATSEKPIQERLETSKRLRFAAPLPELVLSGQKDTTWRIGDDKNLTQGDIISLQRMDGTEFAKAELVMVKETTFGQLTDDDKRGHESFASNEEMLQTYSKYYDMPVTMDTPLKIVKFKVR